MVEKIYEPAEDSQLLLDCLLKEFDKQFEETQVSIEDRNVNLLDMGAGSGFIGFRAAKLGCHVVCADINPEAVKYMNKHKTNDIKVVQSDLFEDVDPFKFDILVFNTPYLPNDEEFHDKALHGGKEGYEVTIRFLKEAKFYMYDDSVILLLVSSLTKPGMVELSMTENGYDFEVVGSKKEFMEELLVYRVWRK